jgi:hypothetical protein
MSLGIPFKNEVFMNERLRQVPDFIGRPRPRSDRRITPGREIGPAVCDCLKSEMPFLRSIIDDLHSIVLIGSGAFDRMKADSDIDIAIIYENSGYERVADALVDKAILDHCKKGGTKAEYTSLDAFHAEKYFRMGSPFAFALRRGVVLWDDGFLKRLESDHAAIPGREYYLDALKNSVVCQYYGTIKWFDDEITKDHGRDGRCTRAGKCLGHTPADNLARVIMNILYVALPRHGYMPLMKKDVLRFSDAVYGRETAEVVDTVIRIKRNGTRSIALGTYMELKALAVRLFREIVSIEEITAEAGAILTDAKRAIREYAHVPEEIKFQETLAV